MILRIGNGAGFWGDQLDAPRRLAENGELDYLTLEYLAELTLSIMARARRKDPAAGYARDFIDVLSSLIRTLQDQAKLKIVTNAGGMNPRECTLAAARLLCQHGLGEETIGMISGDDLTPDLPRLTKLGCEWRNLETGVPLSELGRPLESANAYLGAGPIVEALAAGARIVITGRVADASLTLAPAVHEFGWAWDDWNRLAGGSVAGHLIECGAQATGGLSRDWETLDLARVGYPIAELADDGATTIAKPPGTGGRVDRHAVIEQLLYEIGDPAHYLTPDVDVDFTTVDVRETGPDRVLVTGATGRPRPEAYKASLAYHAGFAASGQLVVYGEDCVSKARACAEIVFRRVAEAGFELAARHVECLGAGEAVPGLDACASGQREAVLRMAVQDPRREAVERFTREIAPLITSGPPGLAGYASGRAAVREVLAYWPTLVPRELVHPRVEVRAAKSWLDPGASE